MAAVLYVRSFDDEILVCLCIASGRSSNLPVTALPPLSLSCLCFVMRQLESSGGSFTALLARAPTGKAGYIDSGDVLEEHERRAGGLRIRMKHYFKKQATQQSGPPVL